MTAPAANDPEIAAPSPLASLLRLAVPLIISNAFFTLQINIDRLMLSWYDSAAPGAAFAAAMVFYAPFVLLAATASFAATFVAQYVGAGRREQIRPLVRQVMWFAVAGGVAFLGLTPFATKIFALAGHTETAIPLEATYFNCLCFAALPMIVNAALNGVCAGLNHPGLVIRVNALGCLVTVALGAILIFGLGPIPAFGIAGAGWATVAGSYAAATVAWLQWRRLVRQENLPATEGPLTDWPRLRRYLSFAFPNGLQAGCDVVAWAIFTLLIGRLGEAPLSATSIVVAINSLFYVPMLGLAEAVCVQVGQHLGADRPDRAARSAWLGFRLAGSLMTVAGLIAALSPGLILWAYRTSEPGELWDQTAALVPGLLWFVALYSFFDSMNLVFALALRGAGDTRFVSLITITCGICLLVLPCWFVIENGYGLHAAWFTATFYIAGLAFAFLFRFLWGPWRRMRVIEPVLIEAADSGQIETVVAVNE